MWIMGKFFPLQRWRPFHDIEMQSYELGCVIVRRSLLWYAVDWYPRNRVGMIRDSPERTWRHSTIAAAYIRFVNVCQFVYDDSDARADRTLPGE